MNREVLVALKERVQQASYLLECTYTNGECFCAVGHVFVMGGAKPEEIEVIADKPYGDIIGLLIQESPDVRGWVEQAGFNPEYPSHVAFLKKLQEINDETPTESRKEEVLLFIDSHLEQL